MNKLIKNKLDNKESFAKYFLEIELPKVDLRYESCKVVRYEEEEQEKDRGIDFIVTRKDKEKIPVQVRDKENITLKDILEFRYQLAQYKRRHNKERIECIFLTTSKVGRRSKEEDTALSETINDLREEEIELKIIEGIKEEEYEEGYKKYLEGKKVEIENKPLKLKEHQEEALEKIREIYEEGRRALLVLPCGAGKTITSIAIIGDQKARRIIIVLPTLMLVKQTISEVAKFFNKNIGNNWTGEYKSIVACSDKTVKLEYETYAKITHHVTTKLDEIKEFLEKNKEFIIYTTYDSSKLIRKGLEETGCKIDICVFDEAHKTAGEEGKFTNLLDDKGTYVDININKRLFMTATPKKVVVSKKLDEESENREVYSMDKEEVYGKRHELKLREAIRRGIISDYQVKIPVLTKYKKDKEEDNKTIKKLLDYILKLAKEKVQERNQYLRFLIFCNSKGSAKNISDYINKEYKKDKIKSYVITSKDKASNRDEKINHLREADKNKKHVILSSVRCLTEGVDVPEVDGILFYEPEKILKNVDKVDIIQAIGRALRLSPDNPNKIAEIVVPATAFSDDEEDLDIKNEEVFKDKINRGEYSSICDLILALKEQDEELEEYLEEYLRNK